MARAFLVFFSAAVLALPLWSGGCGSATGGSEFGNPALTGTLPSDTPTALQASKGQTAGCGGGLATVRTVCDGNATDFDVADDCSFSVTLTPNTYCYVQFLEAGGAVGALLSWQDPTQLNDGTSLKLTSFLKMAKDQTHSLGNITLLHSGGEVAIALPAFAPVGFDTNGNGIPDEGEGDFQTGTDTDGDGVPEIASEPPGAGTGGTGTTTTPFTPVIGRTYTPQDTGCGLGTTMTVKSADANEVILEPFGTNGATAFTPDAGVPDTANSVSKNLTILGTPGHFCSITISDALHIQVSCQNSGGGTCEEGFAP